MARIARLRWVRLVPLAIVLVNSPVSVSGEDSPGVVFIGNPAAEPAPNRQPDSELSAVPSAPGTSIEPISLQQPLEPVPAPPTVLAPTTLVPPESQRLAAAIFGSDGVRRSLLAEARQQRATGPATDIVIGGESRFRNTTDAGNLLGKSQSALGVATQQRTPIVTDPRVRASRTGRLLASGSYWFPARPDLDTLLSKIDSRIVQDMIVVKGPYAVRYGPGFDFIDFELLGAPRFAGGYETHGSTSGEYQTNGEQWYGRQAFWGGDEDWGYRVGYGHRGGSDYETGDGFELPSSYKSRLWDVTFGADLTHDSSIEFTYLRLDQTDVEFPGLVFDINFLVTDAYEVAYVLRDQPYFDQLVVEGWYNRTRFEGDTRRSGKNRQIPVLRPLFDLGPDQFLRTDADASSAGYRLAMTWGDPCSNQLTLGTDLIYLKQQLNDIVPERTAALPFPPFTITLPEQNFPIPDARSADVGVFAEFATPRFERLRMTAGARADWVSTNATENTPGLGVVEGFPVLELVPTPLSELKQAGLEQHFALWAVFVTAEYDLDEHWTALAGAGHAQRPPTMTELYAAGPFIGSLNPGLTFVHGDPELDPERRTQIDVGVRGNYERFRGSAHGFYAWIRDYITFDELGVAPLLFGFEPGQQLQEVVFTNTDLATLAGFEAAGELDLNCWLTAFGLISYIEGRDRSREEPSRFGNILRDQFGLGGEPRSTVAGSRREPLPLIPPLETRLGLRLHEPCPLPRWAVELEARIVDDQDRVARSLFEQPTPGFTVWNLRSYWQATDNLLVWGGVENFTDKFYREHLDFRSGRGVFRPGINVYFGSEIVY